MILIISNEKDNTTNDVIDWLVLKHKNFYRLNGKDQVKIIELKIDNKGNLDFILKINDKDEIKFGDISSYWYRRGTIKVSYDEPKFTMDEMKVINHLLGLESNSYTHFLHHSLKLFKSGIGFFYDNNVNKLLCLKIAAECGLVVPNTFVCDNKNTLKKFIKEGKNYISKTNDIPLFWKSKEDEYVLSTSEFTNREVEKIPDSFYPTLFQNQMVLGCFFRTS